ncbi:hypothetical protein KFK09_023885 [Dendrobium nobile]|uniref:Uncharacterized protein n=1 Tax=Dendrobium nobile TaxID=94219 RepID=A0A8T3AC71_DENNO|nr:hypothetical protein KFK09_023885 [Dendrobium nobile]
MALYVCQGSQGCTLNESSRTSAIDKYVRTNNESLEINSKFPKQKLALKQGRIQSMKLRPWAL